MTPSRDRNTYWTETKRVVTGPNGEAVVKMVTCCCEAPTACPKDCALVAGNKTPCRCDCHRGKPYLCS